MTNRNRTRTARTKELGQKRPRRKRPRVQYWKTKRGKETKARWYRRKQAKAKLLARAIEAHDAKARRGTWRGLAKADKATLPPLPEPQGRNKRKRWPNNGIGLTAYHKRQPHWGKGVVLARATHNGRVLYKVRWQRAPYPNAPLWQPAEALQFRPPTERNAQARTNTLAKLGLEPVLVGCCPRLPPWETLLQNAQQNRQKHYENHRKKHPPKWRRNPYV